MFAPQCVTGLFRATTSVCRRHLLFSVPKSHPNLPPHRHRRGAKSLHFPCQHGPQDRFDIRFFDFTIDQKTKQVRQ